MKDKLKAFVVTRNVNNVKAVKKPGSVSGVI